MTTAQLVARVLLRATGKTTALTNTSAKWIKILGLANFYIDALTQERDVDWAFLFNPEYSLGTVSATDAYDIDKTEVYKISDNPQASVRIQWSGGVGYTDYKIVPHEDLIRYWTDANKLHFKGYYCAIIGDTLVFNHTFVSTDPEYGGTIIVPAYTRPDLLVNDSDTVIPEIETWLVVMCAAEYVTTDITLQNRYPSLLAEANEAMNRLKDDNDAQVEEVYREPVARGSTW